MSHTPGPWTVQRGNFGTGRYIAARDETAVAYMTSNGSPTGMKRERSGEADANARLIAAAPELLEALQRVMSWIDRWSSFTGNNEWAVDAERIRAAIAKATQP